MTTDHKKKIAKICKNKSQNMLTLLVTTCKLKIHILKKTKLKVSKMFHSFFILFVLRFFKSEFLVVCIFADSLRNIPRIERPYAGHGRQAQSLQYKNFFQANASHAIMVSSSTQSLLISSLRKNPCQKAPLLKSLGLLLMHFSRSFPLH